MYTGAYGHSAADALGAASYLAKRGAKERETGTISAGCPPFWCRIRPQKWRWRAAGRPNKRQRGNKHTLSGSIGLFQSIPI